MSPENTLKNINLALEAVDAAVGHIEHIYPYFAIEILEALENIKGICNDKVLEGKFLPPDHATLINYGKRAMLIAENTITKKIAQSTPAGRPINTGIANSLNPIIEKLKGIDWEVENARRLLTSLPTQKSRTEDIKIFLSTVETAKKCMNDKINPQNPPESQQMEIDESNIAKLLISLKNPTGNIQFSIDSKNLAAPQQMSINHLLNKLS